MSMPAWLGGAVGEKYDWFDTENWFFGGAFSSNGYVPIVIGILIFG